MAKSEIMSKMNALADELVAKDAKMSRADAIVKVAEQHPELYRQYRDAAESAPVAKAERTTVHHIAMQAIQKEIERVIKARGLDRGAAAMIVAKESPELIALSKERSASRTVDEATIQKSAAWLETHVDMTPGKALAQAIEYDALPPPVPTVPVPHAPAVQKKDPTDAKIQRVLKICEETMSYLEENWGVQRRPIRKFAKAMTFNEVRALDRAATA